MSIVIETPSKKNPIETMKSPKCSQSAVTRIGSPPERIIVMAVKTQIPAAAATDRIEASVPRLLRKQAIIAAENSGVSRMASTS